MASTARARMPGTKKTSRQAHRREQTGGDQADAVADGRGRAVDGQGPVSFGSFPEGRDDDGEGGRGGHRRRDALDHTGGDDQLLRGNRAAEGAGEHEDREGDEEDRRRPSRSAARPPRAGSRRTPRCTRKPATAMRMATCAAHAGCWAAPRRRRGIERVEEDHRTGDQQDE